MKKFSSKNKQPRVKNPLFSRKSSNSPSTLLRMVSLSNHLFTASLHPWTKSPRFPRSLNNKISQHEKGFTLIELLITMVIMGILGAALLTLQYILGTNQTLVVSNYLSIDEANSYVNSFVREIRSARSGDNAAYALATVNDYEIIFYSDIDYDGDTERVRYTVNSNVLSKGIIEPVGYPATYPATQEKVQVLSDNIRNDTIPVFYYYNEDWPEDTTNNPLIQAQRLSATRTVRILLKLNQKANDPANDYTLDSFSQIRMLKENL